MWTVHRLCMCYTSDKQTGETYGIPSIFTGVYQRFIPIEISALTTQETDCSNFKMDPVCISGREGRTVTGGRRSDEWNGYQWNIPLDEVFDCDSAPECCRNCYYKNKGMSKKKKSVIVFLIFAVSIILTALIVRFSLGTIDIIVGVGDQRPIINQDTNFSPLLCSRYSMTNIPMPQNPVYLSSSLSSSASSNSIFDDTRIDAAETLPTGKPYDSPLFDAYMLLDTPYRSYQTSSYDVQETMRFPSAHYFNYWASHFDSGSEVTIRLCPHSDIALRILRGKSALDKLLEGSYLSASPDHIYSPCFSSSEKSGHIFHVSSYPDDYAFVFTLVHPGSNDSTVVTFSFRRKELIFDEAALYASCSNVDQCSLSVPNKAKSVLIEMKQNATAWPMTIRTECVPSIGMYFAFFLGVPVGFIVFLLSCGGILYLCQRSVMNDIEAAENRRQPRPSVNRSSSSSSPNITTSDNASSGTITRTANTRRAFRTTTSSRAPLVDHDVLSAMAEVNRQYDLPPTYNEVEHASSPVSEPPPPSFESTQIVHDDDPPSYDSIAT